MQIINSCLEYFHALIIHQMTLLYSQEVDPSVDTLHESLSNSQTLLRKGVVAMLTDPILSASLKTFGDTLLQPHSYLSSDKKT